MVRIQRNGIESCMCRVEGGVGFERRPPPLWTTWGSCAVPQPMRDHLRRDCRQWVVGGVI
eukprot:3098749-Amphidinium_carterae.1